MNNKINILIVSLLTGIFVMLAYLVFTQKDINVEMSSNDKENQTIDVSGKAYQFVKPDTASVNFSITKQSSNTQEATQSVNQRAKNLINQLKKVGIAEKDIKTIDYNINPEYSYNNGQKKFTGYRVTQRFKIIIRNLGKVSQALAVVNDAGVDDVSQLSFYVNNEDKIKRSLRQKAIDDAKKNARELSKELGVSLDKIVGFKIKDEPNYYWTNRGGYTALSLNKDKTSQPVVPSGENKFELQVVITYKIKN